MDFQSKSSILLFVKLEVQSVNEFIDSWGGLES